MKVARKDIRIEYYRSSGPGGQRKNKRETAVRIRHLPTGITAIATENRSQASNAELALRRIESRVGNFYRKKKVRIPTRVSRGSKRRRLDDKTKHKEKKQLRKKDYYD